MKIGVTINNNQGADGVPHYPDIREKARMAETVGFDSIWLFDHLLFRFDPTETVGIWECWTLLSALAEATSRVELGTLVLCSPFRNPALLAKMAHTLDEVSRGRLILGLGAGWHEPEFDAFGYSFEHRVDRFEEALQIVKPLLSGETVDFEGEYYQARDCVIAPPGPRPAGIPLLVGAGKPRMLRLVARYADMWNTVWLGDPAMLDERLEDIHTACADVGRDPLTLAITAGIEVHFPDLGDSKPMIENPLTGTSEELAQAFQKYDQAGVSHLIVHHSPTTLRGLERLAEALDAYRTL
jgi:probable F420-dependent oxidoreductase